MTTAFLKPMKSSSSDSDVVKYVSPEKVGTYIVYIAILTNTVGPPLMDTPNSGQWTSPNTTIDMSIKLIHYLILNSRQPPNSELRTLSGDENDLAILQ